MKRIAFLITLLTLSSAFSSEESGKIELHKVYCENAFNGTPSASGPEPVVQIEFSGKEKAQVSIREKQYINVNDEEFYFEEPEYKTVETMYVAKVTNPSFENPFYSSDSLKKSLYASKLTLEGNKKLFLTIWKNNHFRGDLYTEDSNIELNCMIRK